MLQSRQICQVGATNADIVTAEPHGGPEGQDERFSRRKRDHRARNAEKRLRARIALHRHREEGVERQGEVEPERGQQSFELERAREALKEVESADNSGVYTVCKCRQILYTG